MSFEVGSLVKLGEGGASVFRIVAMDDDGDPTRVIVEPATQAPGGYPFPTPVASLVPAEE
ncbi:hypothetical protein [Nocardia africana]